MNKVNKIADFFYNGLKTKTIHKWHHYFDIYDKHFRTFMGKTPIILEIGVSFGGSIDMWNNYFNHDCIIYGIDIDKNCGTLNFEDNVHIVIGDQGNPMFWDDFFEKNNIHFDIVIDDGGHTMQQQIITFEKVYSRVKYGGIYLCEDLHTSYWDEYGGGYLNKNSFIEYSKNFIDLINAYHVRTPLSLDFRKDTFSITFYDSIIVLEKYSERDEKHPSSQVVRANT